MSSSTIFNDLFDNEIKLVDRYLSEKSLGIDVIIPLFNTNPLWKRNLLNFYQRIPINSLIIGDGGCTDDSIEVVRQFPRVKVLDQRKYKTLGYSMRELIIHVQTPNFIYLHSDVFLPENWFETMYSALDKFDWFECPHRAVSLLEYGYDESKINRALSGAQMGKTELLKRTVEPIEDDFLYRNEDIVIAELVQKNGAKYGKVLNTFHYHQMMNKNGGLEPKIIRVDVFKEVDIGWEIDTFTKQIYGIVKYLEPKPWLVRLVNQYILLLKNRNAWDWKKFKKWVVDTNPDWNKRLTRCSVLKEGLIMLVKKIK